MLLFGAFFRAFAKIVETVDRYPGLDLFQSFEHPLTIHEQVADHGELAHRLQGDRRVIVKQFIDQA